MNELIVYSLFKLPIANPRVNCPRYRLDRFAGLCLQCEYYAGNRNGTVIKCNWGNFDEDGGMNVETVGKLNELSLKLR